MIQMKHRYPRLVHVVRVAKAAMRGLVVNFKGISNEDRSYIDANTDLLEGILQLVRGDVAAIAGDQSMVCKGVENGAWRPYVSGSCWKIFALFNCT
jgi:hypothetical protein